MNSWWQGGHQRPPITDVPGLAARVGGLINSEFMLVNPAHVI